MLTTQQRLLGYLNSNIDSRAFLNNQLTQSGTSLEDWTLRIAADWLLHRLERYYVSLGLPTPRRWPAPLRITQVWQRPNGDEAYLSMQIITTADAPIMTTIAATQRQGRIRVNIYDSRDGGFLTDTYLGSVEGGAVSWVSEGHFWRPQQVAPASP